MRKLLLLALLFSAPAMATTPLPVYCIAATLAVCNSLTQVGNGTQGDIWWKAFGKVNDIGYQLGVFSSSAANEVEATPNGSSGLPSLRALVSADLPTALTNQTSINNSSVPASAGTLVGSTGSFTLNDCLEVGATSPLEVKDTGSACGSGGSGPTLQTNGTNNSSQTTLNLIGVGGIAVTNPTGGTVDIGPVSEGVNPQTGTTYTIATTDCGKQVTFSNASAIAVTVPQANGSFASCQFDVTDIGAGTATLTPTTSTINGASTLAVAQNRQCTVNSDGTNWQVIGCTALVTGGGTSATPISFGASPISQNTTAYVVPGTYSTSGVIVSAVVPQSGTLKNLYFGTANSPASGQTFVITLYTGTVAGSLTATSVTCTISNPNKSCSDTTDTASISAGSAWDVQVVTSATSGSTGVVGVGVQLQ